MLKIIKNIENILNKKSDKMIHMHEGVIIIAYRGEQCKELAVFLDKIGFTKDKLSNPNNFLNIEPNVNIDPKDESVP